MSHFSTSISGISYRRISVGIEIAVHDVGSPACAARTREPEGLSPARKTSSPSVGQTAALTAMAREPHGRRFLSAISWFAGSGSTPTTPALGNLERNHAAVSPLFAPKSRIQRGAV